MYVVLAVTVGAVQTADVLPALKIATLAPGAGDAAGVQVSQVIPWGAALVLFQVTFVPDDTVTGLWKEKPMGADALLTVATVADAGVPVVVPVDPAVVVPVVPDVVVPVVDPVVDAGVDPPPPPPPQPNMPYAMVATAAVVTTNVTLNFIV